jgi:hypothetical protein
MSPDCASKPSTNGNLSGAALDVDGGHMVRQYAQA